MVAGLLERERQHSRSRRSTADLVRLYLQDIGRVDLLSQEEELTLARLVQRRELLLRQRQQLASGNPRLARLDHLDEQRQREASRLGHQPSQGQWAQACQLNLAALRQAPRRRWPFAAITLGHVIVGTHAGELDRLRAHEQVHVRQCERWGPLFLPAYALAGVWQWLRGRDAYWDNPFEVEARRVGGC